MYRYILLLAIIGVNIVKCQDQVIDLNLSKVNENYFTTVEQSSNHYKRFLYTVKPGYKVNEVYDSSVQVYKLENEHVLKNADVYYIDFIPQLVKLDLKKSEEDVTLYYKRVNGSFVAINDSEFQQLTDSSSFVDKTISLDLVRGFSDDLFDLSKVTVYGETRDQFVLKSDLTFANFTNGTDVVVDGSKNEKLARLVSFKSTGKPTVLQVVVLTSDNTETSKFFEHEDGSWKSVDEARVKVLYETKPTTPHSESTEEQSETDSSPQGDQETVTKTDTESPTSQSGQTPDSELGSQSRETKPTPGDHGSNTEQPPGPEEKKEEEQEVDGDSTQEDQTEPLDQPKEETGGQEEAKELETEEKAEDGEGTDQHIQDSDLAQDPQDSPSGDGLGPKPVGDTGVETEATLPLESPSQEKHIDQSTDGTGDTEDLEPEEDSTKSPTGGTEGEEEELDKDTQDALDSLDQDLTQGLDGETEETVEDPNNLVDTAQEPEIVKETVPPLHPVDPPESPAQPLPSSPSSPVEEHVEESPPSESPQIPVQEQTSTFTLDLEAADVSDYFNITTFDERTGFMTKIFSPKTQDLHKVKYKDFILTVNTASDEVKFNDVSVSYLNGIPKALKLSVTMNNGVKPTKYYNLETKEPLDLTNFNALTNKLTEDARTEDSNKIKEQKEQQQAEARRRNEGDGSSQSPSHGHQRPSTSILDLEAADDTFKYSITSFDYENGLVTKVYSPKHYDLQEIKYKEFVLEVKESDNEQKFNDITATFYNDELRALKLDVAMNNGVKRTRYYDVRKKEQLSNSATYDELTESLKKEADAQDSNKLEEGVEDSQPEEIVPESTTPLQQQESQDSTKSPTEDQDETHKSTRGEEEELDKDTKDALDALGQDLTQGLDRKTEETGEDPNNLVDTAQEDLIVPQRVPSKTPVVPVIPESRDQVPREQESVQKLSQQDITGGEGRSDSTEEKDAEDLTMEEILDKYVPNNTHQSLQINLKKPEDDTEDVVDVVDEELPKKLREAHRSLSLDDLTESLLKDGGDQYISIGLKPSEYSQKEHSDEEECSTSDAQEGIERFETISRHDPEKQRIDSSITEKLRQQDSEKLLETIKEMQDKQSGSDSGTEVTLDLGATDDLFNYNISKFDLGNGLETKLYFAKINKIVEVKYKDFVWKPDTDAQEVLCKDLTATFLRGELKALFLVIKLENSFTRNRYFDVENKKELNLTSYNNLTTELKNKAQGLESSQQTRNSLVLNLDVDQQSHVNVEEVKTKHTHPYKVFRPDQGYVFTGVLFKKKQLWEANNKYPLADQAVLYSQLNTPAYLVLNTPTSNSFEKTLTFDLVLFGLTETLARDQVKHLLETGDGQYHPTFDLKAPILHEFYKVNRSQYKGFVLREFTVKYGRVTAILDNGGRITPTNTVPFMDFSVYYYDNIPVYLITDPNHRPNHFFKSSLGWTGSLSYDKDENLEAAKKLVEDPKFTPVKDLTLKFEEPVKGDFVVENWEKDNIFFRTFMATGHNRITSMLCNDAPLLDERAGEQAAGVKFYLKSGHPYKAEVLVFAKKGKKLKFKMFAERGKKLWLNIDEDDFKNV